MFISDSKGRWVSLLYMLYLLYIDVYLWLEGQVSTPVVYVLPVVDGYLWQKGQVSIPAIYVCSTCCRLLSLTRRAGEYPCCICSTCCRWLSLTERAGEYPCCTYVRPVEDGYLWLEGQVSTPARLLVPTVAVQPVLPALPLADKADIWKTAKTIIFF